jgi:hypothetical protein
MGREVTAFVTWNGTRAETKALLETAELILRLGHKARWTRAALSGWSAAPDGLHLLADGAPLPPQPSRCAAARWVTALAKAPPSLVAKLGIGPDRPVRLIGTSTDAELVQALAGACREPAVQLLAVIEDPAGLTGALAAASAAPDLPVWCVYPKGKLVNPGDAAIRTAFRAAGWIDSKTCAVSARLTATRYARRAT